MVKVNKIDEPSTKNRGLHTDKLPSMKALKQSKVAKIDTPKPKKTKLYWYTLLLSWLPFVGLLLSLNGLIRSVITVAKSKKSKKTDKRAVTGTVFSSIAVFISIVAIIVTINPTPSIKITNSEKNIDGSSFTLTGKISNMEKAGSKLTVNEVDIPVNNGEFSYSVDLEEGDNTFNIVATNENGTDKETVIIHRTTQAELQARAEAEKAEQERLTREKMESEAKDRTEAQTPKNDDFYINNAYPKGDNKYDVVVYSSNRDTLQIYVNDQNPVKAKVNKEGWATFKKVKIEGRAKLSFAKKVGWSSYYPVNYVKYIDTNGQKVELIDAETMAAREKADEEARRADEEARKAKEKADADAKAEAEAKAQAEAQAQHKSYIDGLAKTYCSNHQGNRNIYVPNSTAKDVWENPNKDLLTKYPKQSQCITIMTFFVDTMPSSYIDNIVNARVGTNMNTAEVLAAWGWPNNNSNYTSGWGSSGTWMWDTGTCYYGVCSGTQYANFYNGKVTGTGSL